MKRTVLMASIVGVAATIAFAVFAVSIDGGAVSVGVEHAAAQSVKKTGDRGADLIAEIVGPLLLVLIGAFSLVALVRREVGLALTAAAIGGISGFFVFTPNLAQDAFEGIYKSVF